jgi:hypothetical protein
MKKHEVKKFDQFINEAYSDLSHYDFKDKYDKIFVEYALNEYPINLSEEERKEASRIYGNRDVGIVYHGGKINSEEFYHKLKKLKAGDTIKAKYMSATPSYSTAESFAMYIKSYDEMTMIWALRSAIESGSAGEYGTFVVKLKPKPEQVIFSTYGEGQKPTTAAETECILYGDIEVLDIKIFERLDKENYLEQFKKMSLDGYFNDFIPRWMDKYKIKRPDSKWIIKWVLGKVKSDEDAIDFLRDLENKKSFIFNWIHYDEFIKNSFMKKQLDKIEFYENHFRFIFDESDKSDYKKNPFVSLIKGLENVIWRENENLLVDYYNDLLKQPAKMEITKSKWGSSPINFEFDDTSAKIFSTAEKLRKIGVDVKPHKALKKFEDDLNKYLKEFIMERHIKDVDNREVEKMYYLFQEIEYRLKKILPVMNTDYIKDVISYFYGGFAYRFQMVEREDKWKLNEYSKALGKALQILPLL